MGITKKSQAIAVIQKLQADKKLINHKAAGLLLTQNRNGLILAQIETEIAGLEAEINTCDSILATASIGSDLYESFQDRKKRAEFRLYALEQQRSEKGTVGALLMTLEINTLLNQSSYVDAQIQGLLPLTTDLPD